MRVVVTIIICIFVVVGLVFAACRHVDRKAQPVRDLSKMMSVRKTTDGALSAHYVQHGSYPRSLSELPLETLRWGDEGASPRDLESWHYTSDGQTFSMTWTNVNGLELFLGGKSGGRSEYTRNGR